MLSSIPIFMLCVCLVFILFYFYTYMISWRGYIFIAVRLCVCVCVCESVALCVCQWTNFQPNCAPIWTRFLLDGCLLHWLEPYWNWWLWLKVKMTVMQYRVFLPNSLLIFLLCISTLLCSIVDSHQNLIKIKWVMISLWCHFFQTNFKI